MKLREISREEWREMEENSIKEWHFERVSNGVKPVVGKYNPDNPDHIKPSDVIKIINSGNRS